MKKLLYLLPLLWAVSCGTGGGKYAESASYDVSEQGVMASESGSGGQAIPDPAETPDAGKKKIIREGSMGIRTSDLSKTKGEIDALVAKHGGYYSSENYYEDNNRLVFDLIIRIPGAVYEKFIAEIESGNGKVTEKSIQARDVTEQFVDLETRLTNKRAYLQRYRELVKQAKNIEEILKVEQYVRSLEEEIESAEGRLRYLSDQVGYSTLALQLTEPKPYQFTPSRIGFWQKLKGSVVVGWQALVEIFLFLMKLWPLWAIGGGIAWLITRRDRKKHGKK